MRDGSQASHCALSSDPTADGGIPQHLDVFSMDSTARYRNVFSIFGDGDKRSELHDVTNDVDFFYRQADALLFTSLNEVTPMVIAEAMMRALPVVTTDI